MNGSRDCSPSQNSGSLVFVEDMLGQDTEFPEAALEGFVEDGEEKTTAGAGGGKGRGGEKQEKQKPYLARYAEKPAVIMGQPMVEEVKNWRSIPLQEKFYRGVLRGLRNISETP